MNNEKYSLSGKEYNTITIVPNDGYEIVKLGDIGKIKNGKQLDKKNIINGEYPVYGGGLNPIGYHNNYNNDNCTIIAGTGHCGFVQFYQDKFWASQCFTIKSDDDIINKYLFIICKSLQFMFINSCKGSVQKFIRAGDFLDFSIPIPSSEDKIIEWTERISTPYNDYIDKTKEFEELERQIQIDIQKMIDENPCDKVKLGNLCEIKCGSKFNLNSYLVSYSKYGILRTRNLNDSNDYLYLNKDGYLKCDKCLLKTNNIVMSAFIDSFACDIVKSIWNNYTFNGGLFRLNEIKINIFYLYYYLNSDKFINELKKHSHSSTADQVNSTNIKNIKISIPKDKSLIDKLQPTFDRIELLQKEAGESKQLYEQLLKDLRKDAIKEIKQSKDEQQPEPEVISDEEKHAIKENKLLNEKLDAQELEFNKKDMTKAIQNSIESDTSPNINDDAQLAHGIQDSFEGSQKERGVISDEEKHAIKENKLLNEKLDAQEPEPELVNPAIEISKKWTKSQLISVLEDNGIGYKKSWNKTKLQQTFYDNYTPDMKC